jgi:hypothetical protein
MIGRVTETMNASSSHPTPDLSDIFAYVDAHRQAFFERLIEIIMWMASKYQCVW